MMFDAFSPSEPPARSLGSLPRGRGQGRLAVRAAGGVSRIARLGAGGSAKVLVPRHLGRIEGVFINTGGGLAGGDRFSWEGEAGPGAALMLTTQAAERVYRAGPGEGPARVETRLSAGAGGEIAWLPQETILFDGAALERRLEVDLAEDATLTALEAVVLGRAAMGETVRRGHLVDRWRVRRGGRLVFADALRLTGAVAETAAGPALFGSARAAATLIRVAPAIALERWLERPGGRLRGGRPPFDGMGAGVEWGASHRDGVLALRILAENAEALRRAILAALKGLGVRAPRGWTM